MYGHCQSDAGTNRDKGEIGALGVGEGSLGIGVEQADGSFDLEERVGVDDSGIGIATKRARDGGTEGT